MLEKRFNAVPPQLFTSNGQPNGQITVADTTLFKVKQLVMVVAGTNSLELEVKRVTTRTTMFLGPKGGSIDSRTDLSAFTTALGAFIFADEQQRTKIAEQEIPRAVYQEEPAVAVRSILVDNLGKPLLVKENSKGSSLSVSDTLEGYSQGANVVVTSVAVEAKGNANRLAFRKGVFLYALNQNNYLGFSNTVTVNNGIPIFQNQMIWIPASSDLQIWLVRSVATGDVRVWEVG